MQGLVGGAPLLAEELDHRRRSGACDRCNALSSTSVTEYISERRAFFDPERFRTISVRRASRAQAPNGQTTVHQNQEKAWTAQCRHSLYQQISESGWEVKYARCKRDIKYLRRLRHVYEAHQHRTSIRSSMDLVALEQPFDRVFWTSTCIGWSEDAALESRLRCLANDQCIHMWHYTEFFTVPTSERPRLYSTLLTYWIGLDALRDICVRTPTI